MDDAELEDVKRRIVAATTAWARAASLAEVRANFEALFTDRDQTSFSPFVIGSMRAGFVETPRSSSERIILFCHGGGFQVGSIGFAFWPGSSPGRCRPGEGSRVRISACART
jgi:epsilon-lactone hydrolase